MRNAVVAIVLVAACGPSAAELKTAKTAEYAASPQDLLELAVQAASETYKIGEVDRTSFSFSTQPQFYSATGERESPGVDGYVNLRPKSVQVAFNVQVQPTDEHHATIQVTPKTFQTIAGSPKPRELTPDDPNLPGWVHGRVDSLSMAIYQRAKQYVIAAPGQTAP
jgi:hypothetical protein